MDDIYSLVTYILPYLLILIQGNRKIVVTKYIKIKQKKGDAYHGTNL